MYNDRVDMQEKKSYNICCSSCSFLLNPIFYIFLSLLHFHMASVIVTTTTSTVESGDDYDRTILPRTGFFLLPSPVALMVLLKLYVWNMHGCLYAHKKTVIFIRSLGENRIAHIKFTGKSSSSAQLSLKPFFSIELVMMIYFT